MERHLTYEELALYAEALQNGRPEDCPEAIRLHAETCNQCAGEAVELSLILDSVSAEKPLTVKHKTNYRLLYMLAASAAVILLMISIFLYIEFQEDKPQQMAVTPDKIQNKLDTFQQKTTEDSTYLTADGLPAKQIPTDGQANEQTPDTEPNDLYAEAFIPHEPTEQIVQRFEANLRGEGPEILSPLRMQISMGKAPVLRWEKSDNEMLTIEFFNHKAELMESRETLADSVAADVIKTPGIYYWKLYNSDFDLLFCGKISVTKD